MPPTTRTLAVLAPLAACVAAATAAPSSRLLRLEVARDGTIVDCSRARGCAIAADATGACAVTVRACVGDGVRDGLAHLRVGGTPALAGPLVEALAAGHPGARGGGLLRFTPPLPPGCAAEAAGAIPVDESARVVASGAAPAGRRRRSVATIHCVSAPVPPPTDPGPVRPIRFTRVTVDPEGGGQPTQALAVGDVDGDLLPDVVVAGTARLLWYRNPDWRAFPIADGRFGAGIDMVVRDLDLDGRADVVGGTFETRDTVWFRNTGTGWERRILSPDAYCHDLAFGDLDGDGRADAACVDQQRGRIVWLRAPAVATATPWALHVIDPDRDAMGAVVTDMDGDRRPDLVTGRYWYRNGPAGWTRVAYTDVRIPGWAEFDDYAKVTVRDFDGDGRLDVFATLYAETPVGRAYAFLAPPDPVNGRWTPVLVDPGPLFGVHSQAAATFDGSARQQVMVAETNHAGFGFGPAASPRVLVYRLLGAAADPAAWERTVVDGTGTHEARAVDLTLDGLPDLVGHQENTDLTGTNGPVHAWINATGR